MYGRQADEWHLNCVRQCIFKTKKAGTWPKNVPDCLRLCAPYAYQGLAPHGPLSQGGTPSGQSVPGSDSYGGGVGGSPGGSGRLDPVGMGSLISKSGAPPANLGSFHGFGQLPSPFNVANTQAADAAHLKCVQVRRYAMCCQASLFLGASDVLYVRYMAYICRIYMSSDSVRFCLVWRKGGAIFAL